MMHGMTTFDAAKRRRVMQRSQRLGHCVCDPRRGCPCEVFSTQRICPCAGERAAAASEPVRLTALAHNAGCASKIPPGELAAILGRLTLPPDPAVLSGIPAGDDAGVYRLTDDLCLVQTVDVMTPCVDDPATFGRICAANCLSDIYAMGGTPRTALSILAFPYQTLDGRAVSAMLAGALAVLAEAGVAVIGGHSLQDEEVKLGFAITGTIDAAAMVERGTARVGDRLVLTKPLGTGVLAFARQIDFPGLDFTPAERSMAALNKDAAAAMRAVGVSACTDVTGFGLFGHLSGMLRHSGVSARLDAGAVPVLPGVLDALRAGVVPGAIERNREYVGEDIRIAAEVEEARVHLGFDAQTSGGLLIAVPAERHAALLSALHTRGIAAATIGEITGDTPGHITLNHSAEAPEEEPILMTTPDTHACCCGDAAATAGTSGDIAQAFGAFMRTVAAGGAIDARTKELITLALVIHARCAPCLRTHLEKARGMGINDAEIDEAAWLAIAMGGAPVRMFYQEIKG